MEAIWNDTESQDAFKDVLKDAGDEYDFDAGKADALIENEGNNSVEDFGKMAGEDFAKDNEWFAGWFDAFGAAWDNNNDDGRRDFVPGGWYMDSCYNGECYYYYNGVDGYFYTNTQGASEWRCY